jgi:very-short-patch-repair endonuclease
VARIRILGNTRNFQPGRGGFFMGLRNNSTSAEAALWNLLKNKQLEGRKFRRQQSIGKYIVDFYCSQEKQNHPGPG